MPGIYICKCIITNKVYIGQTYRTYKERWDAHKYQSKTFNDHFHRAIRKYGWDKFVFEVLHDNIDTMWLDDWEIYYINLYNSFRDGYNSTNGGSGTRGVKCSEETKYKISIQQKGIPKSIESRLKMSIAKKGKPYTELQKIANKESLKYKKHTSKAVGVSQFSKTNQFIKSYRTVKEAYIETGACDISSCCKGKRKTSKGFIWKYTN